MHNMHTPYRAPQLLLYHTTILLRHTAVQQESTVQNMAAQTVFTLKQTISLLSANRKKGPFWWKLELPSSTR